MNSSKILKPAVFFDLLKLIEEEIKFIKDNCSRSEFLYQNISKLMHRYIEILDFYKDALNTEKKFIVEKISYVNNYIDELWSCKQYRWLFDISKYIRSYSQITVFFQEHRLI